ncbi:MAG: ferredoxin, 2Fe-2S [Solirubrobacteraceae bacterium]|jgi:2Fe-2S ferredoxin|nr:ferredoxin, 2Fe-2S [Solirubrobacteraceae bacterium]
MPAVTYIHPDGTPEQVQADVGTSVMMAAVTQDVDGIVAECGGSLMCATCHVYVDEAFADRLPEMSPDEDEMLEAAASERLPNSRLSCQLVLTDELDGLVVRLPETQI